MDSSSKNKKTNLLIVGVPEGIGDQINNLLDGINTSSVFKGSVAEAVKTIDIDDDKEINGLLLNIKNFPTAEKRAKQKGSDVFGFISAATGLIEDALNKEVPIILTSAPDNCVSNMITDVMIGYQDVDQNITIAKLSDVDTVEGLKTTLIKSAEATSFEDKTWNLESIKDEETSSVAKEENSCC
ncbi:MAG: hypothetical protein ISR98_00085 [Parcubacteria group bacterium]|nr:hypothetical protein [Parcubacteria group bacterium]